MGTLVCQYMENRAVVVATGRMAIAVDSLVLELVNSTEYAAEMDMVIHVVVVGSEEVARKVNVVDMVRIHVDGVRVGHLLVQKNKRIFVYIHLKKAWKHENYYMGQALRVYILPSVG